eukprot:5710894-Ditylum_brightwellii.AAC.1
MSLLRNLYLKGAETRTLRRSENTPKGRNIGEIAYQTDIRTEGQTDRRTDRVVAFKVVYSF